VCGIAGIVLRNGAPVDEARLRAMAAALAHRGPDDEGTHRDGPVGLAHRRLSILDPSPAGHQPMADAAGEVVVAYNGELYNYPGLRRDVEATGVALRTRADTELLPYLWRAHGPSMVDRLRGMFAFAIHDRRTRTVFLARDRFGQKPLYYAALGDRFLFASELKAIVIDPAFPRVVDRDALRAYLALGYVPDGASIYRAARKLPPAHTLTVAVDALDRAGPAAVPAPARYWRLALAGGADGAPATAAADWEARLEAKLEETVRAHLLSDVPLGAFLSGGVDSSMVVALMTRAGSRVRTFSIGFEEAEFSELEHARAVARHLGADHTELVVRPDKAALLARLAETFDEPFADPSALPTFLVAQLAREHVTVALSGDGGDEVFGGYERYWRTVRTVARARAAVPGPVRDRLLAPLARAWPSGLRGGGFLGRLARPDGNYADGWMTVFGRRLGSRALDPSLLAGPDPLAPIEAATAPGRDGGLPLAKRLQAADIATYLPGDILVKVDRASMAVSLEARAPLLDHELAELAASLPLSLVCTGAEGKVALKSIARRLVPREAVDRRKMGFGLPIPAWLRGDLRPLVRDVLLGPDRLTRAVYRRGAVERLVAEHESGAADRAAQIWSMVALELFFRRWRPALP